MITANQHGLRSIAGGLGARCAPSGEREGQSHLASYMRHVAALRGGRQRAAVPPILLAQSSSPTRRAAGGHPAWVAFECVAFKCQATALRGRRQGATRPLVSYIYQYIDCDMLFASCAGSTRRGESSRPCVPLSTWCRA